MCTDHESVMLLLHQSAKKIASVGIEPTYVMMKTLCLNHLTIRPIKNNKKKVSPVQVLHLFQLVTKQLHYFYAN